MKRKSNIIDLDPSIIPEGYYCYTRISPGKYISCPYWSIKEGKPTQQNGYCEYLHLGDWMDNGTTLLWDSCKECGINYGDEE